MPFGGLTSSGTGLQLQANTPGTTDTGNFHVSGKGITQNGLHPAKILPTSTIALDQQPIELGAGNSWPAMVQNDDISLATMIGHINTLTINPNGNNTAQWVCVGYQNTVKGGQGVTIGNSCINGSANGWPTAAAKNTVLGSGAACRVQSATASSVAIGESVGETVENPTNGSICIGRSAQSSNATGYNIVQGFNATAKGTNSIIFWTNGAAALTEARSNLIKIGDSTNTVVEIGPLILAPKPTITGAKGGNAALADLLTKLAAMNLITDSTTA